MSRKPELLGLQETAFVDDHTAQIIRSRQASKYDPAHGELNLSNVGVLSDAWGRVFGLNARERLVLRFGSRLHDIQRSPSEVAETAKSDAKFSAEFVVDELAKLNESGLLPTTFTQRIAIKYGVETHGSNPWVEDPTKLYRKPRTLAEKFRQALYLSDKWEQIDLAPAVMRRAMFVSGKRLQSEGGDLQRFHLSPESEKDRLKAFLLESLIRITFINPEKSFPKMVQEIIQPIYNPQKDFINALCKSLGISSTEGLARLVLETRNVQGDNLLDVRKLDYPNSEEGLVKVIEANGDLTTEGIVNSPQDAADSASETVLYLAGRWKDEDLEAVVKEWNPRGELSRSLKDKFYAYVDGSWAIDMQRRILEAA